MVVLLDTITIGTVNRAFGLPAAPRLLTDITGLDAFANIHDVDFSDSRIESIGQLSQLPHLKRIWLNDSLDSDISPLTRIHALVELNVGGTLVTDFSLIKNHDQLLWLTVSDNVSNDILDEVRRWLPECEIRRVSDPH